MRIRLYALRWLVAIVAAALLVAPGTSDATADWIQDRTNVRIDRILTHADGSVSAVSCNGMPGQAHAATYSPSGVLEGVVEEDSTTFCPPQSAAGSDGTLYGIRSGEYNNGTISSTKAVAYKAGQLLWSRNVTEPCTNGKWPMVYGMALGHTGILYVLVYVGACNPDTDYYLYGIASNNGAVKFQKALAGLDAQSAQSELQITRNLVVVKASNYRNGGDFRYFSLNGTEQPAKRYKLDVTNGELLAHWAINASGTLFVQTGDYLSSCDGHWGLSRVIRRSASGVVQEYNLRDRCFSVGTDVTTAMQPLPNGDVAFVESGGYPWGSNSTSLLLLRSNGEIVKRGLDFPTSGYEIGSSLHAMQADSHGNLALLRELDLKDESSGRPQRIVELLLVDSNGELLARANSELFAQPANYPTDKRFSAYMSPSIGLTDGAMYVTTCDFVNGDCIPGSYIGEQPLHRFGFREVGYDYPRSAIMFKTAKPAVKQLNMVSLGDSFSSGEGNPPFEDGTDEGKGGNNCHRSPYAYPRLIASDSELPIAMQAFRACSGATTWDVIHGSNGERGQLDSLNKKTDIVTITVGGNDIGFAKYVEACVAPSITRPLGCFQSEGFYEAFRQLNDGTLRNNLTGRKVGKEGVFTLIGRRAKNAQVYVMGYPQLIPGSDGVDLPGYCAYLEPAEKLEARGLTASLNAVIKEATISMGPRFHFIDASDDNSPFRGKELCNNGTYFNGVDLANNSYSMHPNQKGHDAYRQLIASYLSR